MRAEQSDQIADAADVDHRRAVAAMESIRPLSLAIHASPPRLPRRAALPCVMRMADRDGERIGGVGLA